MSAVNPTLSVDNIDVKRLAAQVFALMGTMDLLEPTSPGYTMFKLFEQLYYDTTTDVFVDDVHPSIPAPPAPPS